MNITTKKISVKTRSSNEGQALPGQKAADCLELAHAGHRLPGRPGFKIGERQPKEMMEQSPAQFDIDPVRGVA